MTITLPNFLLVGAPKCGTSSLYKYLVQHPEIFMPANKEPMFFISEIYSRLSKNDPRRELADRILIDTLPDYQELFKSASLEAKALGEASAAYLYHHKVAIPNIQKYLGDVRIIIILRNPVERAYSSYYHLVRDGMESLSFEAFLGEEKNRKAENWDILNYPFGVGLYYKQVEAYLNNFSEVLVLQTRDLADMPELVCQNVFRFLGVDHTFVPNTSFKLNATGEVRSHLLNKIISDDNMIKHISKSVLQRILPNETIKNISKSMRRRNMYKKQMNDDTRKRLNNMYRSDVENLQSLINQDTSDWLR